MNAKSFKLLIFVVAGIVVTGVLVAVVINNDHDTQRVTLQINLPLTMRGTTAIQLRANATALEAAMKKSLMALHVDGVEARSETVISNVFDVDDVENVPEEVLRLLVPEGKFLSTSSGPQGSPVSPFQFVESHGPNAGVSFLFSFTSYTVNATTVESYEETYKEAVVIQIQQPSFADEMVHQGASSWVNTSVYAEHVYVGYAPEDFVTPTPTPSSTPSRTPTMSSSPTITPSESSSASVTPSNTATSSETPSITASRSPTGSPTSSLSMGASHSETPTVTISPTSTGSVSSSASVTSSPSSTASKSVTSSSSPTSTVSSTKTKTQTETMTASASESGTATSTSSVSPSKTASASNSATSSVTASPSSSPSNTATNSVTATSTGSHTPSSSSSTSPTHSASETASSSATVSSSRSQTASSSPTRSSTQSISGTTTISGTMTSSRSLSPSTSSSVSPTQSSSATATSSATVSPSRSETPSVSATHSASETGSSSATVSPSRSQSPSRSSSASLTSSKTATSTLTTTGSASKTRSSTMSGTGTATMSATNTATSSVSPTSSSTFSATSTGTSTSTSTMSATRTASSTVTKTKTSSASQSVTATSSVTASSSASCTVTPSPAGPCDMVESEVEISEGSSDARPCALKDTGGWVVVYKKVVNSSDSYDVVARIFDVTGIPVGDEFIVHDSVSGLQRDPVCSSLNGSGFAVAWVDRANGGYDFTLRLFSSSGTARIDAVVVSDPGERFKGSSIGYTLDGGILVAWYGDDSQSTGVYAQRVSSSGALVGARFIVHDSEDGVQEDPQIITLTDGDVVVAWLNKDMVSNGGSSYEIRPGTVHYRRYDGSSLADISGEVEVPKSEDKHIDSIHAAALSNGGYVFSWYQSGSTIFDEFACLYDSDDNEVSCPIMTLGDDGVQYNGNVAASGKDGGFVAFTSSSSLDADSYAVGAQWFTNDGTVSDSVVQVNEYVTGMQQNPQVTTLNMGGVIVVWEDSDRGIWYMKGYCSIAPSPTASATVSASPSMSASRTTSSTASLTLSASVTPSASVSPSNSPEPPFDVEGSVSRISEVTLNAQVEPHSCALRDTGGFVVVFQSQVDGTSEYRVYARVFDAAGSPVTGDIALDGEATNTQTYPRCSPLNDGGFAVVWVELHDGGKRGYVRLYTSDGTAVTDPVMFNLVYLYPYLAPTVTYTSDGGALVVFSTWDIPDLYINAQKVDASGSLSGDDFSVAANIGDEVSPMAATFPNGDIIIAWESRAADSGSSALHYRRYSSSLDAVTDEIVVPKTADDYVEDPDVAALPNGGYAFVWHTKYVASGDNVYTCLYDSDDNEVECLTHVMAGSGSKTHCSVTSYGPDGEFVVTATSSDADDNGVAAQWFHSDGTKFGSVVEVNDYTTGDQEDPWVTTLSSGGIIVSWESAAAQDGSDVGIYMRGYWDE